MAVTSTQTEGTDPGVVNPAFERQDAETSIQDETILMPGMKNSMIQV